MSKAHGLQFSSAMVRALLDGSKTMTRRKLGDKGPRFKAGDTIWVRETFRVHPEDMLMLAENERPVDYKATENLDGWKGVRWKNSRYMPRWASRINLVVTATRVERLGDISESDAKAEGAGCCLWFQPNKKDDSEDLNLSADAIGLVHPSHGGTDGISYRNGFANLWESIHGAGSWYENPEVEVISFEVQK